jgi:hypothetical protein
MGKKKLLFLIITQMYFFVNLYGAEKDIYFENSSMDLSFKIKELTSKKPLNKVDDYGNFMDLTLEISTDTKDIIPMEPLPITITLSNKTDKVIMAINVIDPSFGLTSIYVQNGNKPFEIFKSADWGLRSTLRIERALEPGFKESVDSYLFYAHPDNLETSNRGQYLFETSGRFHIKAIYTDSQINKSIESNILSIEVKEPKGDDANAFQYIKSIQDDTNKKVYYGNFLLWPIGKSEIDEKQNEFIRKFPNTKYSRFLYYTLGKRDILQDREKLKLGIEYLEKAASYENFLFAEDSILKLINTFTEIGETEKARKYKEILAQRFPNSSEGKHWVEEVLGQVPQTFKLPEKKPLGVVLPIAGAAVAVIVIAGVIMFLRKKKPKQAE